MAATQMMAHFACFRPGAAADVVIRGGRVLDPAANLDVEGVSVWVSAGRIREILPPGAVPPPGVPVHDARGCWVLPGLVDLHVHLREPGCEAAEDIASGTRAALAGGFTTVCAMPNTLPPPDTPPRVQDMQERCRQKAFCSVEIVAAATLERRGRQAVDVAACKDAGAVAFSDDGDAVSDLHVMQDVLVQCAQTGAVLSDHCERVELSRKAPMAAGEVQHRLGLAGQPWTAETVQLAQGILLAAAAGARYHAQHLSSRHSVELVRWAKKQGFPVTAEVTVHHLALTEHAVAACGALAKCAPPLRAEEDRQALLCALQEGVIDAVVTDHAPHEAARKQDLESAAFGVIGLETALAVMHDLALRGEISLATFIGAMTGRAATCYGLADRGTLSPGAWGDITVYDPSLPWVAGDAFASKSRNSPFIGRTLPGRVRAVFIAGTQVFDAASAG